MNNDLKKLLLCLKWDVDNIEDLNNKRDYISGRIADIQGLVKNCSIQSVSGCFIAEAEKKCNEYIQGYNTICRPDENFEKYYEKGWIEAINWVVRNYR